MQLCVISREIVMKRLNQNLFEASSSINQSSIDISMHAYIFYKFIGTAKPFSAIAHFFLKADYFSASEHLNCFIFHAWYNFII